jgi:hypothetical protein
MSTVYDFVLRDNRLNSNGGVGLNLQGVGNSISEGLVSNVYANANAADQVLITGNTVGILFDHQTASSATTSGKYGVNIQGPGTNSITFNDIWLEGNTVGQMDLNGVTGITVRGGTIQQPSPAAGIVIDSTSAANSNIEIDVSYWNNASAAARIDMSTHAHSDSNIVLKRGGTGAVGGVSGIFVPVDVTGYASIYPSINQVIFALMGLVNTSVTGTAGTASCSESTFGNPHIVSCYLAAYQQTSTAQTYTVPVPFQYLSTPVLTIAGATCGAFNPAVTWNTVTFPANAAMVAETCQFTVTGQ